MGLPWTSPVFPENLVSADTAPRGGAERLVDTREGSRPTTFGRPKTRSELAGRTAPTPPPVTGEAYAARRVYR
jgi:hypothetical protein